MASGLDRWHHYVATRDAAVLDALLAEGVVFYSPVVHTPQAGKAITRKYLEAALAVFGTPDFTYVGACSEGHRTGLEFETRLDGVHVNGVDIITWTPDGRQIAAFKVMIRPLKAIDAVQRAMGQQLQRPRA